MKRIIDGKTYNTDTATTVARYEYEDRNGYETEATIYVTKGGAFFAVHEWEVPDPNSYRGEETKTKTYAEALSRAEVDRLVATEKDLEIFNEKALALPPEAVTEEEAGATIYVRVPEALKAKVDEAASGAGTSINAWALRCFEACLARSNA
jgi:predicted HicB family RNase H-like nuclease